MSYCTEFRQRFLKDHPDRTLSIGNCVGTGHGTHKYKCVWTGDWTAAELVNYVDGSIGNYGGRIDNYRRNEDGTQSGIICVYYD